MAAVALRVVGMISQRFHRDRFNANVLNILVNTNYKVKKKKLSGFHPVLI
jgi:hypothetical protein